LALSRKKYSDMPSSQGTDDQLEDGPYQRSASVKVSLGVYIISLVVVALIVFVAMLVQYLPGYRNGYRVSRAINNSNVSLTITIPMSETEKRKENPFTREQRERLANVLEAMGAKSAAVKIEPQAPRSGKL